MVADSTIRIAIKGDGTGAKVIKRDLDDISKKANVTKMAMRGLATAIIATFTVGTVMAISKTNDQMKLLEARIKSSTKTTQEFKTAYQGLLDISSQTGASFESAVEVFQRLSFVREEIKATSDEMLMFTANVQKLGVVSGAGTQALNAGLTQLGQGLGAGILRAEEFNSILENIPAVANAIANQFGVTTGQLRNLVLEGEVLSEDVFSAILNQTADINKEFDAFPETIGRATARLKLDLAGISAEFDKTTGTSEFFIKSLGVIGNTVRGLGKIFVGFANLVQATFKGVFGVIYDGFMRLTQFFVTTINGLSDMINKLPYMNLGKIDFDYDGDKFRSEMGGSIMQDLKDASDAFGGAGAEFLGKQNSTQKGESAPRELSKDYAELAKQLKEADDKTKGLKDSNKDYMRELERLKKLEQDRGNEIGDMLFELGRGYTSLRDVAVKALDDILRSMFRLSMGGTQTSGIFGEIGGSIFESLGGLFGGGGGSVPIPARKPTLAFASGGSFKVGGNGGTDSQHVSFMATPDEVVEVKKPHQMNKGGGGVVYNIDARGAENGVEQKIQAVLQQVNNLRKEVPSLSVASVQDANNRNLGFLR